MEQQRRQVFWSNLMRQRPGLDTDGAQNPSMGPPGDSSRIMAPPCSHQPESLLDREKTTAMLLLSGVALAMVGVPFTFMGWRYQQTNPTFEWLKVLGPVLISVGFTFALMSICKFGTNLSCRQGDGDVLVMTVAEQTSRGHCCTISGRSPPIMIHDVTTILCAPPDYSFVAQDVRQGVDFQPCGAVCGLHAASASACSHSGANRCEKNCTGCGGRSGSSSSQPPAYEDIYPSS